MDRQAWVEINLKDLRNNYKAIERKIKENTSIVSKNTGKNLPIPKIAGIVKADAYGSGAIMCAKTLVQCGCDMFAVATVKEGIDLRSAGIECSIFLLGIAPYTDIEEIIEYNLTPVISSVECADNINNVASIFNKKIKCTIAIDTGMGRIGWQVLSVDGSEESKLIENALTDIKKISEFSNIEIIGAFSHFAVADEFESSDRACESIDYTKKQCEIFSYVCDRIKSSGVSLKGISIANSSAIIDYPESMFDVVRPGIILYGDYPFKGIDESELPIKSIMSVKAEIVYLKRIKKGTSIGYGRHFIASRDSVIATLPIGYADGYSRIISGKAYVLIRGKRVPVIGSICMDQCMIDVTDIEDVQIGDQAIILGEDEFGNRITSFDLAELEGTINYEVLCSFGMRLPHIYIEN